MPWCSTGYGRDTMLRSGVWPGFCPRTTGSIPRLTTTVSRYYELAAGFLIPGLSPTADGKTLVPKYDRLEKRGSGILAGIGTHGGRDYPRLESDRFLVLVFVYNAKARAKSQRLSFCSLDHQVTSRSPPNHALASATQLTTDCALHLGAFALSQRGEEPLCSAVLCNRSLTHACLRWRPLLLNSNLKPNRWLKRYDVLT
ncbi:hypothetical protein ACLKA7_000980 [Drosophila subpalustris]